jgi:hypothetical protein
MKAAANLGFYSLSTRAVRHLTRIATLAAADRLTSFQTIRKVEDYLGYRLDAKVAVHIRGPSTRDTQAGL